MFIPFFAFYLRKKQITRCSKRLQVSICAINCDHGYLKQIFAQFIDKHRHARLRSQSHMNCVNSERWLRGPGSTPRRSGVGTGTFIELTAQETFHA